MSFHRSDDDEPVPMRNTLDSFLRHLGAPGASTLSTLGDRWAEVVGPALGAHTHPGDLVDGVLAVICDEGAWAAQIRWQEKQIRTRFAETFPGSEIRKLTVRVRPGASSE